MTSYRQMEANRRNALKSTGPRTETGKQSSRCNAIRHGLTAKTVISPLGDTEDYKAFERAIVADYDAQSAVERELVLRLASLLWRLRRAMTIETGLFDIQAEHLRSYQQTRQLLPNSQDVLHAAFGRLNGGGDYSHPASRDATNKIRGISGFATKSGRPAVDLAQCFLRLANMPNFAIDRLSRYEAALWRQVAQTLFALDVLDRRKPQERRRRVDFDDEPTRC